MSAGATSGVLKIADKTKSFLKLPKVGTERIDAKAIDAQSKNAALKNVAPGMPNGKRMQSMISGRWIVNVSAIMTAAKTKDEIEIAAKHNFQPTKLRAGVATSVEQKTAEIWSAVS